MGKYVKRTIEQRFYARVVKLDNGCWEWQGSKTRGYGSFTVNNEAYRAHVFSYIMFKGPIPEGMQIDHLCRKRDCVNPEHLEAVTQLENVRRSNSPGAIALRTGKCMNGHALTPENARPHKRNPNWRHCMMCAANRKRHYKGLPPLEEVGIFSYSDYLDTYYPSRKFTSRARNGTKAS